MADVGQWMAWHGMCGPVDGMAWHVCEAGYVFFYPILIIVLCKKLSQDC